MKTISLLHPFSAKAIGLCEEDLFTSHSKPHERALLKLQEEGYTVSIDYFTGKAYPFSNAIKGINKRFWPISKPLFKNRHGWRKQYSQLHFLFYRFNTPDLTILNMSGHGSAYCFRLARQIIKKRKAYIAMIGGMHISDHERAMEYYKNAHHIVVHTEVQKKQLEENKNFKDITIKVMPLGIDTETFKPKYEFTDKMEFLFVGRISRLKQIELSIQVVSYLKENQSKSVHLSIVGPISDVAYFNELQSLVEKMNLDNNISFLGTIEQKKLVPYYQKADLLLLPSAHESFGMVMVEAMACGTPVAALKGAGGPDELIQDSINGLLCSKKNFNFRILEFVNTKELQMKMRCNARMLVEKKWSIVQTVSSLKHSLNLVFQKIN